MFFSNRNEIIFWILKLKKKLTGVTNSNILRIVRGIIKKNNIYFIIT